MAVKRPDSFEDGASVGAASPAGASGGRGHLGYEESSLSTFGFDQRNGVSGGGVLYDVGGVPVADHGALQIFSSTSISMGGGGSIYHLPMGILIARVDSGPIPTKVALMGADMYGAIYNLGFLLLNYPILIMNGAGNLFLMNQDTSSNTSSNVAIVRLSPETDEGLV